MGPAAYKLLSQELPLRQLPTVTLPRDTVLHHFGAFDAANHKLDRPIWVSDAFEVAQEYQYFGVPAPFYTVLSLHSPLSVADLNGKRLQPLAAALNMPSHRAWNVCLAAYLRVSRAQAILYAGREIFLADPAQVIGQVRTVPSGSIQGRR